MVTMLPHPDRFEERGFLGRGGAGEVYLVWDRQRRQEVALKVVRTSDRDLLFAEKNGALLQEELARAAPQVPKVHETGKEGDFFFVVMEYVAGHDLAQILRQGALAEVRAIRIAIQLCDLLNRLHNYTTEIGDRKVLGIIHGDIKPENIRVLEDGRIRVLDFGIAKQLSLSRSFTTNLFGSLPYVPPERLESGKLDDLSDLWATGVVLYSMVSGRLPFAGSTPEEVRFRLLQGELLPLPDSCSRPLRWVILKSLSFTPGRRYQTAAALQADLEAVLKGKLEEREEEAPKPPIIVTQPQRRQELDRGNGRDATHPVSRHAPSQATRRTVANEIPSTPVPGARSRKAAWPIVLFSAGLALLIASQVYVRSEARALRRQLVVGEESEVPLLLQRYNRIRTLSPLGFGLGDLRQELAQALKKEAERILARYRGDDPSTSREDWEQARRHLAATLDLDSADIESQARLIYCRGHLALADAEPLQEEGELEAARKKHAQAVADFEEAADLDPRWPDPYLSLARVYAYEQFDLEKLERSLELAEKRGYAGRRHTTAIRADGHLKEGRRLYSESLKIRGREGEEEILGKASSHLGQARALYRQIPGYTRAQRNQADAARQMRLVENRLEDLSYQAQGW